MVFRFLSVPPILISRCSGVRSLQKLFSAMKTWKAKLHYNWQLRKDMSSETIHIIIVIRCTSFYLNWVSCPKKKTTLR